MTKFMKSFVLEVAMLVIGYVAVAILAIVGRMTIRLGRSVFSR